MMELFTLGADRGAYTEEDVRQQARALTGWQNRWGRSRRVRLPLRPQGARHRHQDRVPQAGRTSTGRARAASASGTRQHASFFVNKLWSYFVPTPPDKQTAAGARGDVQSRATRSAPSSPRSSSTPTSTRASAWSSRRSSTSPGCCAGSARDHHHRLGVDRADLAASSSSTRRTSPAGTTPAGSTRRRSAAAGRASSRCSRTTPLNAAKKLPTTTPTDRPAAARQRARLLEQAPALTGDDLPAEPVRHARAPRRARPTGSSRPTRSWSRTRFAN